MVTTKPRTYKELYIACPRNCQFHPDKITMEIADILKEFRGAGEGGQAFMHRASALLGRPVSRTSVQRHYQHYREVERVALPTDPGGKKLADLEILDLVIQRGAANSMNWKPTIKDTIEAMKLKMQMTGNSAFDDLIALFDGVEADEAVPEAEEALLSEDERSPEEDEPLPEPLT